MFSGGENFIKHIECVENFILLELKIGEEIFENDIDKNMSEKVANENDIHKIISFFKHNFFKHNFF